MNLTHRFLNSYNEVATYITAYFDDYMWDDLLVEDLFDSYVSSGWKFVLFEDIGTPTALLAFKSPSPVSSDPLLEGKYEILLFEVSEKTFGRGRGYGEEVIKYFKNTIATENDICGYSLGQSAPFWKKVSTVVDSESYSYLKETDFEGEIMMYFKITH